VAGKTDRHHANRGTAAASQEPTAFATGQQTTIGALTCGYCPPRQQFLDPGGVFDSAPRVETKRKRCFRNFRVGSGLVTPPIRPNRCNPHVKKGTFKVNETDLELNLSENWLPGMAP